ncbi:hypothetical protein, partial [Enterococcus canis]
LKLYEKIGSDILRSPKNLRETAKGEKIYDYFVIFTNQKPDFRGHRDILQAGEWTNYGSKLYRIDTILEKEEIQTIISKTFNYTNSDFFISKTFFY